jgi:hypothetical protein
MISTKMNQEEEQKQLLEDAKKTLEGNWTGSFTIPAATLYPHQWSWDSAFIAIGNSYFNTDRAIKELEFLFNAQWHNGMLPHTCQGIVEEIRKLVDRRIKAIVYTMASSGMSVGAWDYLRWGHIKSIERDGKIVAAKIIVYAGEDDEYFTYISPEVT